MYVDWGLPHLSLLVCYISHLLIPLRRKIWYCKECNKNTKNLVLDVIRTLGTSNETIFYNFQNTCFSLYIMSPKIDVPYLWILPFAWSPSIYPTGYYRSSWTVYTSRSLYCIYQLLQKNPAFYCNDNKITEFEIIDSKISSTAYVILYELIDLWRLDSNRRVVVWLLPWRRHILSILLIAGRGISAKTCGLDYMFPPDDLCYRPESLCWYVFIYTYAFFLRVLVIGRIYTYTGGVVQYWWSCTPSQSIWLFLFFFSFFFLFLFFSFFFFFFFFGGGGGGCAVPMLNANCCFLCLWPLVLF